MSDVAEVKRKDEVDWFVTVDPDTGIRAVVQGIDAETEGAVGPYTTLEQAIEWAGHRCWECAGEGKVLHRQGGPHGIDQRMMKCTTCKGRRVLP